MMWNLRVVHVAISILLLLSSSTLAEILTDIPVLNDARNELGNENVENLDPLSWVNHFIGTGGFGAGVPALYPGAQEPFGMARLSPDTSRFDPLEIPVLHMGGYYYYDTHIRRFSHLHMVGPGVTDYGNLGVMAFTKEIESSDIRFPGGLYSEFDHSSETANPGYYSVTLKTWDVLAELTATQHVGVHRYSFPLGSSHRSILIDPAHELHLGDVKSATVSIQKDKVTGVLHMQGSLSERFGGFNLYYIAKFSEPYISYGTYMNGTVFKDAKSAKGQGGENGGIGCFVSFEDTQVTLYMALSLISLEQAEKNLEEEVGEKGFDTVRKNAEIKWRDTLGLVQVNSDAPSRDNLVKFYTSLYHAFTAPTNFSEAGGNYVGFDKKVHNIAEMKVKENSESYFSDMSIWDTHRTQFPLLTLLLPTVSRDIVRSLENMKELGGDLPRWPLAYGYTGCMIGAHATVVVTDNYLKGVTDFNVSSAYQGAKLQATGPREHGPGHIDDFNRLGFVPVESGSGSAARTLAYSFDDGILSLLAKALGYKEDAALFENRSHNYKNIWNPDMKYFCARHENNTVSNSPNWDCPLEVQDLADSRYVEGDARHWRWFVPHDIDGLICLFCPVGVACGDKRCNDYFISQLYAFLNDSKKYESKWIPNPAYWAGNEPDILAPWLFALAGRLDLNSEFIRFLMTNQYDTDPDGVPGNDDYGTLSAWYSWAAMGLYPLSGTTKYIISTPLFHSVSVHLPTGTFTITAENLSETNIYIQKCVINGREVDLEKAIIDHTEITKDGGSLLQCEMGSSPPQ